MTLVVVARTLYQGDAPPLEARVEVDPYDDGSVIRGMAALRRAVIEIAERYGERCTGCFVGRSPAGDHAVHLPDCEWAPDDLIEVCRAEMYEDLYLRANPDAVRLDDDVLS